jgi:hypothetical protein
MLTIIRNALVLTAAAIAPAALADTANVRIESGDLAITPIAGEVVGTRPLCPQGAACFVNGTVIDLSFTLLGCGDRLGPVTYTAKEDDGKISLFVSALDINTERSQRVFCFVAPTARATITLVNLYGTVDAHFLTATTPTQGGLAVNDGDQADDSQVDETVTITCREPVDHGAKVSFSRDGDGKIVRAVYTETSFVDTAVVADMRVCAAHEPSGRGADRLELTATCHDTLWTGGHDVELYEGGFTGRPVVKIFQGPQDRSLVKQLDCAYE